MAHKHSLGLQIKEIDREIALRRSVYPGLVHKRKMTQSVADMHVEIMGAAKRSLEWLQTNEAEIRPYIEALNANPELKGKRRVVLFFGDEIAAEAVVAAMQTEHPNLRAVKVG